MPQSLNTNHRRHNVQIVEPTYEHLFTNITHNNQRFRVLTQQCKRTISALGSLQVFWVKVSLIQSAILLQNQRQFKEVWVIFGIWFVANLWATILAINHRKRLIHMLTFSLLNLTMYLFICTVMTLCFPTNKNLLYPTFFYIIAQIIGSLFLLYNRSKLFPKFMFLLQLLLIILKLDQKIQCQWIQVYFGFLLLFFVTIVVVLSMIVFIGVNVGYFQERIKSVKNIGIGFVIINGIAIGVGAMIPISQNFFNIDLQIIGILAIICNMVAIFYGKRYKTQIILFMCRVQKIKAFNQYITLVKIPTKAIQSYVFIKKSQNWYQRIKITQKVLKKLSNMKTTQNKLICNLIYSTSNFQSQSKITSKQQNQNQQIIEPSISDLSSSNQQNKCLICLQLEPCMIWMPCGHLTVCQICCDKMLQSKNCNCLLCKDLPQAIYFVEQVAENQKRSQQRIKQIQQIVQQNQSNIQNQNNIQILPNIDSQQNLTKQSSKNYYLNSLSGIIYQQNLKNSIKNHKNIQQPYIQTLNPNQILKIRCAYSVKIN